MNIAKDTVQFGLSIQQSLWEVGQLETLVDWQAVLTQQA